MVALMPTIRRFANCKIFDLCGRSSAAVLSRRKSRLPAVVEIETMAVRAGSVRKAPEGLRWARDNIAQLRAEWRRLNRKG
jgi:hypothetical protein